MASIGNKSQEDKLINHFMNVGDITAVEATDLYRIRSLTRRITELRRRGMEITSVPKKDALGQRYVRYYRTDIINRRAKAA